MQTKTYFASSVPAALEVARRELGADALLVNSKPAPAEVRNFGRLEVTFAFEPNRSSATNFPEPRPEPERRPTRPTAAVTELDEIRQQISALRAAVGGGNSFQTELAMQTALVSQEFRQDSRQQDSRRSTAGMLCASGLEPELAKEVASAAALRPGDGTGAVVQELVSRIPRASFGEMKPGEARTLAFLGQTGRGKSTTLVKIAVRFGLAKRVPVRIYSAGAHGVGCLEQMARYATIIGVPFQSFESFESLNIALNDGWKGLILIDTPGISPGDRTEILELERFFARRGEIEKHLVLRADAQTADMFHVVSRFSGVKPSRLLFTGLDEVSSAGAMVNTLIRSNIPAAFVGTGPRIPDDLTEISAVNLAHSICEEQAMAAVAA
jgi:flagellar biosynthesis protein FlhF